MNKQASVTYSTAPASAMRRTAWRAGAAALVLALAGAAGGMAQAQPAPPPPAASAPGPMGGPMGGPMHEGHRHGGPGMGGRHMERLLERVNATPEQRGKIRGIFDAAAADMRTQRDTRRQLHEQGLTLLAQPTIDTAAVEQLRQQMLAQHDLASQRWSKAMVDAANVLTPQQRTQLAALMREHAARGPGGQHR
ncbi:Spy/CpxP family protein refolding chaperone [Azohydromonas lata]|uniref:Spy/CpxP family protein refolding chaperone n=1 Tax=Azohydromonas lata TaxID=45677 RepID=A0ABU5IQ53_9BURK|nr:Spy/CpxP family protein refolding chaperone [Azohydromonas lata]MDZ5461013.1 Spy/CpxP family protein refolding chaperone [Azohydromonas lata]